jgi:hypothetical protein
MAKTQAKSKELGDSVKAPTVDERIDALVKTMEQAKEVYLRSLGALEVLQSVKKEKEENNE